MTCDCVAATPTRRKGQYVGLQGVAHPETHLADPIAGERGRLELLATGVTRLINALSSAEDDDIEYAGSFDKTQELSPRGGLSFVTAGER